MYKFDTYIDTIIGDLKIGKKKKEELADEFSDHLELLQQEFINNGFSEGESIKRAIERFGESSDIKKKLHKSLFIFRNSGNVVFGVVITLIMIIFIYIPMVSVTIAYNDYNTATFGSHLFSSNIWYSVNCVLFFIPIGYFLPIILNKFYKVFQLAPVFSVFGLLIGVYFSIALTSSVDIVFLLTFFASGLLGGITGYILLIAVNRFNVIRKNEGVTRFFSSK